MRQLGEGGEDPLQGVANFFDVGIVFALGFLLSLVSYLGLPEVLAREDFTIIKNPGTPQMEILQRKGIKLERYKITRDTLGGEGEKLGTAYRLKSGEVVYVPETGAESGR